MHYVHKYHKHIIAAVLTVVVATAGVKIAANRRHVVPTPTVQVQPTIQVTGVTGIPHCTSNNGLPDPTCTPGSTDPAVTQANIQQTICVQGYTSTIRPPVSYTSKIKAQSYKDYGVDPSVTAELDHLISLELGGNPTDPKNLWVEVGSIPNPKDKVENYLHKEVCAGKISLQQAQQEIANDWTKIATSSSQ